jgi:hypothetical protein
VLAAANIAEDTCMATTTLSQVSSLFAVGSAMHLAPTRMSAVLSAPPSSLGSVGA